MHTPEEDDVTRIVAHLSTAVGGTGAAIGAQSTGGSAWHTGWWLETQGSRHLAHLALRAVCHAELAIDPPTSITERVIDIFGESSVEKVLHSLTAR